MLNRRRFLAWVERRILSAGDVPDTFKLCHVDKAGAAAVVCTLEPLDELGADDIAEKLADNVHEEVLDHIEGYPGRQQYVIRAFAETDRPVGEFPFGQIANSITHTHAAHSIGEMTPEMDALAGGHLPMREQLGMPTAMVSQQQMRHNEGLVRAVVEMSSMCRERDAQIIRGLQATQDKYASRNFELLELVETMQSQQQERELARKTYEEDKARKDSLLGKLNDWVLPAMAKEAGIVGAAGAAGAAGEKAARALADIATIFKSLKPESQDAFVAELDDEPRARLLGYIQAAGAAEGAAETKH